MVLTCNDLVFLVELSTIVVYYQSPFCMEKYFDAQLIFTKLNRGAVNNKKKFDSFKIIK